MGFATIMAKNRNRAVLLAGVACFATPGRCQLLPSDATGPGTKTGSSGVPTIATGPDDKSYILAAVVAGVRANLRKREQGDCSESNLRLPRALVSFSSAVQADARASALSGEVGLSFLREGLDLAAMGIASRQGVYGGGIRLDLTGVRSEALALADRLLTAREFDRGLIAQSVRSLQAWQAAPHVTLLADYRNYRWDGDCWSVGLGVSTLMELPVGGGRSGAIKLAGVVSHASLQSRAGTIEANPVSVQIAYQDHYPVAGRTAPFDADTLLGRWQTEVGAYCSPRHALAPFSVYGAYCRFRSGPPLKAYETKDDPWRAYVEGITEFTVYAGIGAEGRPFAGLRITKCIVP